MDCRDAQFYLRMRRHGADELGPDVTAPLDDHLGTCAACAADARALASFDRALAAAMVRVPVPAGLRDRLVSHAASKQGAILRRKAYQGAGLVAAALLLVGIGIGVFSNTRPEVNTTDLVNRNDEQYSDPPESTRKWLAAQKLPERLPLPFDYALLVGHGSEKVRDQNVPVIVFRSRDPRDRGFAKVYLFPHDGGFNLKSVQDAQASWTRAEVFVGAQEKGRERVTYVFVYTGGPDGLKQFFRTAGGPTDPA